MMEMYKNPSLAEVSEASSGSGSGSGGVNTTLLAGFWETIAAIQNLDLGVGLDGGDPINPKSKKKGKQFSERTKHAVKTINEIGASAEFIDAMDKILKGNNKILGRFGSVGS